MRTVLVNGSAFSSQTRSSSSSGVDHRALGAEQHLEDAELLRRQPEVAAGARGRPPRGVEPHVAAGQDGGARLPVAARQRVDARDQLGEPKRLGQVVVGSERQAVDHVVEAAGRGQHQDLDLGALEHERATDVVAVQLGQVAVQHDHVVGVHPRFEERVGAVAGDVHGQTLAAQPAGDGVGYAPFVLGDEHAHGSELRGRVEAMPQASW